MPFEENLHNKFYYILIQKYCSKNILKLKDGITNSEAATIN